MRSSAWVVGPDAERAQAGGVRRLVAHQVADDLAAWLVVELAGLRLIGLDVALLLGLDPLQCVVESILDRSGDDRRRGTTACLGGRLSTEFNDPTGPANGVSLLGLCQPQQYGGSSVVALSASQLAIRRGAFHFRAPVLF
ncbi:MAG: hypothetical protein WKH64_18940 [Chloroflexia bacterium]